MKIDFKFKEKSRANNVYILVNYAGGDADTDHPEENLLYGIKYSEINVHLEQIEKEVEKFKQLQDLLEDHDIRSHGNYNKIKEEHGQVLANLYDNAPNDPQADYQFKCYISSIELIAYDEQGNRYESYT